MSRFGARGTAMAFISCAGMAALLGGCQMRKSSTSAPESYEIKEATCTTGLKAYDSKAEYCNGLRDQAQNNSCAMAGRQQLFEENCPGVFTLSNDQPASANPNVKVDPNTPAQTPADGALRK